MAYRDDLEAARDRIRWLERELAETQARLATAEAEAEVAATASPAPGSASKRERRQRRREVEARERARQRRDTTSTPDVAPRHSWLGRAASPLGYLLSWSSLLVGGWVVLGVGLGIITVLAHLGAVPARASTWFFLAMLGYLAPVGLLFAIASLLTALATRRERAWAGTLPFTIDHHAALYDAFMLHERRLLCRISTTSSAASPAILEATTTLAHRLDADALLRWHDGHLELELPLPPTTSAWRAARQVHTRVHTLVDSVLTPLHRSHPIDHITLHTRL